MRIKPTFSLLTLFWLVLVFSAFFVGRRSYVQPVVVASKDLALRNRVGSGDFHIAYRVSTEIPPDALSDHSSLEGKFLCKPVAQGTIPVASNFLSIPVVGNISLPRGYEVLNVELPTRTNPLAAYLLKPGDLVGLTAEKNGTLLSMDIAPVRVFNIGYTKGDGIAGLLVDEKTVELVSEHRRAGDNISITVPRTWMQEVDVD